MSKEDSRRSEWPASKSETVGGSGSEERRDGHGQETGTSLRPARNGLVRPATTPRNILADGYLSLKMLAEYSALSVRTLRGYLANSAHPLPCYRIGGKVLVRRSEYDAWARQFRTDGPASLDAFVNEVIADVR